MNYLFKNIQILSPEQGMDVKANLWIKDGKINKIDVHQIICDDVTIVIDATNLVAAPGFFDMHVHFREPGFEYKEDLASGAESAANGGFTGVVVMPNTKPPIFEKSTVDFIRKRSKDFLTDIYISGCITKNMDGGTISDMEELSLAGVVLFTDDGKCVTNSEVIREAFELASKNDLLLSQHCEDTDLTVNFDMNESEFSRKYGLKGYPSIAEESILCRDILAAEFCGNRRYHAQHISTKNSVEIVRNAKNKGLRITAEVTPHHFSLKDEMLFSQDTNLKMNPPLRSEIDILALIDGLKDGTIEVIATDHAPHSSEEKGSEFQKAPNGILGLETSFGVSITYLVEKGHLTLSQLIEKMSVNPRRILGLNSIKMSEGEIANLTIFNPNEEWIVDINKFKSKSRNSPYDKMKLKGKVKFTINKNQIYISDL